MISSFQYIGWLCGAAIFGLGSLWMDVAVAQESDDEILVCAQYQDDKERLKCLNQLLELLMRARNNGDLPDLSTLNRDSGAASSSNVLPPRPESDFGLPERRKEAKKEDRINVLIVAHKRDAVGRYYFLTADGQVWKQTETKPLRLPDENFRAEIRKGFLGGYRLRSEEITGFLRVERTN